jgi:hypothetical protein
MVNSSGNRPVIACMNFDLLAALEGRTMGVSDLDGNEYVLRMFTADELLERAKKARDAAIARGEHSPPLMSRKKAIELTAPIGGAR